MKKDVFATWFKELCSLVFIQTIQAFIFAIIMVVVISTILGKNGNNIAGIDSKDLVAATGVIAIIALASISKIEDLIKKIFGVSSTVSDTSMKGGLQSVATGMVAAKLAGRVLNNAGKVGSGAMGVLASRKDANNAKSRFTKKMNLYLGDNKDKDKDGSTSVNDDISSPPKSSLILSNEQRAKAERIKKNSTQKTKNSGTNDINPINETSGENNQSANASDSLRSNISDRYNNLSKSDKEKVIKAQEDYEDALAASKKKRREGFIKMGSGVSETIGGIAGGIAGGLAGASTGEVDNIFKTAGVGMGVGDFIGELPGKVVNGGLDVIGDVKALNSSKEYLQKQLNNNFKDVITKRKKIIDTGYSQAKRKVDEINRQVNNASNAGNIDS